MTLEELALLSDEYDTVSVSSDLIKVLLNAYEMAQEYQKVIESAAGEHNIAE
jgi:hypothetical protein